MATKPKKKQPAPKAPAKKPTAKATATKPKGPKRLPNPYADPKVVAAWDAESTKLTSAANDRLDATRAAHKRLRAELAEAKKDMDAATKDLSELIHYRDQYRGKQPPAQQKEIDFEGKNPEGRLPNVPKGKKKKGKGAAAGAAQPAVKGNPQGSQSWYPVDLWKQYPLDRLTSLGLQPADVEKLAAGELRGGDTCPITTVGDVEAFQAAGATGKGKKLTEIKGIGAESAKRIVKAVGAFWSDWPTKATEFAVEKGFKRPLSEPEPAKKKDEEPTILPMSGEYDTVIDRAKGAAPAPA